MTNMVKNLNFKSLIKFMLIADFCIMITLVSIMLSAATKTNKNYKFNEESSVETIDKNKFNCDSLTEWQIMIMAMIGVESEYNAKVTSGSSKGYLQITPIYVKEVNNITDNIYAFTLEDALNPYHSFKMFEIMNMKHNTNKDIDMAIKLHNPGGGKPYANRIKKRMQQIKAYEKARKELLESCRTNDK